LDEDVTVVRGCSRKSIDGIAVHFQRLKRTEGSFATPHYCT